MSRPTILELVPLEPEFIPANPWLPQGGRHMTYIEREMTNAEYEDWLIDNWLTKLEWGI